MNLQRVAARHARPGRHDQLVPGLTDSALIPRVAALALAAVGGLLLASGLRDWGEPPYVTQALLPASTEHLPQFLLGLLTLVLARGLLRRRWLAHRIVVAVLAAAVLVTSFGPQHNLAAGLLCVALVAGLVAVHGRFPVQPDPGHVRVGLRLMAVTLGSTAVLMSLWLVATHPALHSRDGLGRAISATFAGMAGWSGALTQIEPSGGGHLGAFLVVVTGATLMVAVGLMLAAWRAPGPASYPDRRAIEALAALPVADTFAPFALRHDKSYAFSPDGRAAVGYRVVYGVAVVGGDPVGHADAQEAAVDAFLHRCADAGWRPAAIAVRGDLQHLWTDRGLRAIGVGDEVVVDPRSFTLDTPRLRNVRQAVKRSRNFGVTAELKRESSIPAPERAELLALTRRCWGGGPERGFSMNLDELFTGVHDDTLVVICRDAEGAVVAFQRYATCAGGRALSLDTMCRCRQAPNGVNERMIVEAIAWARDHGASCVSLNFAAFRTLFEKEHRNPIERVGYRGAHMLDRFLQVESLYRFNAKFRPQWVPRSVVLRLPDIGWVLPAALELEFGRPLGGTKRRAAADEPVADAAREGLTRT